MQQLRSKCLPKNHQYSLKLFQKIPFPFVVYADCEYFTKPLTNCEPDSHDSFTMEYQNHEPSGFCLYLKDLDGTTDGDGNKALFHPIVYTKQ